MLFRSLGNQWGIRHTASVKSIECQRSSHPYTASTIGQGICCEDGKAPLTLYLVPSAKPKKTAKLGVLGGGRVGKMGNMDGKAQTLPDQPIGPVRDLEVPMDTRPVCGAKAWMECRRS